jgi:hypothetical protein
MSEIDTESAEFIDWAMTELDDHTHYETMLSEIKQRLDNFYAQPKEVIMPHLKAKMTRGAHEHGAPSHPTTYINEEIDNEYIDLLGWELVKKWNERKERQ